MGDSHRQLLKILIGVAWIDGQVSDVEQQYLRQVAQDLGLADDPEINTLLNNIERVAIEPADCYQWVRDFLGNQPSVADYQQLLDALSGIVYSDGDVATAEAQLLMSLQELDPQQPPKEPSAARSLLSRLRTAYQQWVGS